MPRLRHGSARRVFAFLATVGIAVTAVASSPSSAVPGRNGPPDRALRVATFNIQHGVGLDGLLNLERIAQVIEAQDLDVVGLQEVDRHWNGRSDWVDQASWLADRLSMHFVYGANVDRDPDVFGAPRRQYGTALLSRYRIHDWENTLLPRPEGGEQRGLLQVTINVRGVMVRVLNTHLQNGSRVERLAQVASIREVFASRPEPIVLLGDINAAPGSPELAELSQDVVDAWLAAGEGEGYTYRADSPYNRIDYVMSSPEVVPVAAEVVPSDASDHLPVVVDLTVPGSHVGQR